MFAARRIRELLAQVDTLTGITSLAGGADQVFAQAVVDVGGSLHVVVPCRDYPSTFTDAAARSAYRRFLDAAARVDKLAFSEPSEQAFFAAGKVMAEASDWVLAVWDGQPARGLGGSADVVAYARSLGRRVDIVWPEGVAR